MRRPKRRTECIVCLIKTQQLDATGRCRGCADALAASKARMTYEKYMAQKAREEARDADD